MQRPTRTAVPALALALAALLVAVTGAGCSAGVGGDWPEPPKGALADCHEPGDRCGVTGWCGVTEHDEPTCCPVPLVGGRYCPWDSPGVTQCEVDTDCPGQDCRGASTCISGVCFAPLQERRTYCSRGACDETGACVPCKADAECEAVNTNECAHLICLDDGTCTSTAMDAGTPCNFSDGTCDEGRRCVAN